MKINLNEINITFSEEEMKEILELKGYKVEGHEINTSGQKLIDNFFYAIPVGEEFNYRTHKYVEVTFKKVLNDEIKNSLLSFLKK